MAPTKQLAVVINAEGGVDLKEVDVPKPGPGEILVKVVAAAQNPTDWSVPLIFDNYLLNITEHIWIDLSADDVI